MSDYINAKIELELLRQAVKFSDRLKNGIKITDDVIIPEEECGEIQAAINSTLTRLIKNKEEQLSLLTPVFTDEYVLINTINKKDSIDTVLYNEEEYILDLDTINVTKSPTILIKGYRIGDKFEYYKNGEGKIIKKIPYYNIRWSKEDKKILSIFKTKLFEEEILKEKEENSDE